MITQSVIDKVLTHNSYNTLNVLAVGLAMAKQAILRRNGTIEAESVERGGGRFLVKMYTK